MSQPFSRRPGATIWILLMSKVARESALLCLSLRAGMLHNRLTGQMGADHRRTFDERVRLLEMGVYVRSERYGAV